jgi:hypothetical protein
MSMTRRLFAGGLTMAACVPGGHAASDDRALFWSAEAPGQPKAILFAYERVGAAVTADIVRDGERFVQEQDRLIAAIPNVKLGESAANRNELKPLLGRLSPPDRDRVQALLTLDGRIQTLLDKVSGVELVAMVIGEGQSPSNPSVGGTIAERAQAANKPMSYLLSSSDLQSTTVRPDLRAVDEQIDGKVVTWLLDLRDRVGPVGKHYETLYAERRAADIVRLNADMRRHGVPGLSEMSGVSAQKIEALLIERTRAALKKPNGKIFMMLPLGTLCRDDGILAALRQDGVTLAPIA